MLRIRGQDDKKAMEGGEAVEAARIKEEDIATVLNNKTGILQGSTGQSRSLLGWKLWETSA